ncbi:cystathionine gamma-synthase [Phlyctema vagabunda]|uniref:Cystathionine gamma-synthase n=1 Tax=Phlyctema vagabunda TaxID=108571 RepID=A0ABR4P8F4_9HELO
MPGWDSVVKLSERDFALLNSLKSMYPRVIMHKDVKELSKKILECAGLVDQGCLLFSSPGSAAECCIYVTSTKRGENMASPEQVSRRSFRGKNTVYAVFFPREKAAVFQSFWTNAGIGISSRFAEGNLEQIERLKEVTDEATAPNMMDSEAHRTVSQRLADLFEREPLIPREAKVSPKDVFFFPTGMAAIYSVHKYLLTKLNMQTVLFGFAFSSTIRVFQEFGPECKFYGLGTNEEIDELEQYLDGEYAAGRSIQAVWAEFPSNPLLFTPNLDRLRELADKHAFVLIVDDTISSVCNVDLLGAADIVVTSLTKSFNGYADVMAGSALLNPSSPKYPELRALFHECHVNDFYIDDAEALAENSKDYLIRSEVLNRNAATLVDYLSARLSEPACSVARVFYPNTSPSAQNYRRYMRPPTAHFVPGYGCLFSVEFKRMEATIAFYEHLNVHKGPHLGAHLTLAFPYAKGIYGKELEWAARYNLRETQIRISVGLEDEATLLQDFAVALRAADAAYLEFKRY